MSLISFQKSLVTVGAVALTSLGLVSSALAIPSFLGGATLTRTGVAGSFFQNLSASGTSFCFLTQVAITETDTPAEKAECLLTRGGIVWTLEAKLGGNGDESVTCAAICYSTN
jgi:hypothetical protein